MKNKFKYPSTQGYQETLPWRVHNLRWESLQDVFSGHISLSVCFSFRWKNWEFMFIRGRIIRVPGWGHFCGSMMNLEPFPYRHHLVGKRKKCLWTFFNRCALFHYCSRLTCSSRHAKFLWVSLQGRCLLWWSAQCAGQLKHPLSSCRSTAWV